MHRATSRPRRLRLKRDHGARLHPLLAFSFVNHVANLVSSIQFVKATAENGVPVQIDFVARVGDQEAIIREQADDGPDRRRSMRLDVASHFTGMVLQLALGCIEGIADRDVQVLIGVMFRRLPTHDDFAVRHDQLDAHVVEIDANGRPPRAPSRRCVQSCRYGLDGAEPCMFAPPTSNRARPDAGLRTQSLSHTEFVDQSKAPDVSQRYHRC